MNEKKYLNLDYHSLNQEIKKCWDKNVMIRASDLEGSTDISYINLIMPWVLNKTIIKTHANSKIIDIGCGCGFLTNMIYKNDRHEITGIDISPASIEYAKNKYPNITFLCEDICEMTGFAKFDLCLAIMVLNNMPDIKSFFRTISNLLIEGGTLILVLPHPCFWPQQHLNDCNFAYSKEMAYQFSFSTQGRRDYSSHILYFHRKLETYLKCIEKNGFLIADFHEITEPNIKRNPDILCMELTLLPKTKRTKIT